MKKLYFVAGLPRSGSTMMINLLKQNPSVDGYAVSSLCPLIANIVANWNNMEANKEFPDENAKINVLKAALNNYHNASSKKIIFDKDRMWVTQINLLQKLLDYDIKILCPVRSPAEIITSFEKIKRNNPLSTVAGDIAGTTIASRALYYAGPTGILGLSHASIKDAIIQGHTDKMLFVEYNRFCNSPKAQLKRIYDFFELPKFEHNFKNIEQTEIYNDLATNLPGLHKIKPSLERTVSNCVEYIGMDLYEQYNREIFWDAWV
jgi:sulfotransferase